jgi:capping protein alpha
VQAILGAEQKYQASLEAAYATMDTSTFKALRRQLPVTACKIDWDKIGHAKIGPPKGAE